MLIEWAPSTEGGARRADPGAPCPAV